MPASVLARKKQGFHLPVRAWLAGPLRPRLSALLEQPEERVWDLLDLSVLRHVAAQHASARFDRSAELWFLLVLDAFVRHGPGGSEA